MGRWHKIPPNYKVVPVGEAIKENDLFPELDGSKWTRTEYVGKIILPDWVYIRKIE